MIVGLCFSKEMKEVLCLLVLAIGVTSAPTKVNYASAFLGGQIVDHHEEARGAQNLLNDDRERYMLLPCRAQKKSFTVQLSRDVVVSSVSLANSEFFSSGVKNFTLLGSLQFPCQQPCLWKVLGNYRANSTRNHQHFSVARQTVRFIKFLWVSSTGSQLSCTMTSFRVFGIDVLDSLSEFEEDDSNELNTEPKGEPTSENGSIRNFSSSVCSSFEQVLEESYFHTQPFGQCPKRQRPMVQVVSRKSRVSQRELDEMKDALSLLNSSFQQLALTRREEERKLVGRLEASERDRQQLNDVVDNLRDQLEHLRRVVLPAVLLLAFATSLVAFLTACFALHKSRPKV